MYSLSRIVDSLRQARSGRRIVTTQELGRLVPADRERLMSVRCDVERIPAHSVEFAQRMIDAGLPGTFYFHSRTNSYDRSAMLKIQSLGHEVGYHYECLDRCRGNFAAAEELFLRELERFRSDGVRVSTVCMHGELWLRRQGYRHNLDMITRNPDLLARAGLEGEAFEISRRWNGDRISIGDTYSVYRELWQGLSESPTSPLPLLYVALHPHRWHPNSVHAMREIYLDVRQAVWNGLWGYRSYDTVTDGRHVASSTGPRPREAA
ncbi:MAG: hypothetical protein U0795_25400 [Pirellulales bacterium]